MLSIINGCSNSKLEDKVNRLQNELEQCQNLSNKLSENIKQIKQYDSLKKREQLMH